MALFNQTTASRAVLIEVSNVLGAFREHLVIVGGWVPELLFPNQGHIGSLDVDFAISPMPSSDNAYKTILKRMIDAGYSHQTDPTRFVKGVQGSPEPVKVDFISGQFQGNEKSASIQLDELRISCLRGIDLAFLAFDEMAISGSMPDGSQNIVQMRIVRAEAYILIKAFALDERAKEKDAYDVAFILHNYQPSLDMLAEKLSALLQYPLAREGYEILQAKFAGIDSVGPVWAARVYQNQGQDYDRACRAVFEDAQELFRKANYSGP
jgi:hypothetical protein